MAFEFLGDRDSYRSCRSSSFPIQSFLTWTLVASEPDGPRLAAQESARGKTSS